ncbi:MAG TPA: hypothetical protein VF681_02650 [Abditibacteriaceae bacterium]|jgi:hypothetical protein
MLYFLVALVVVGFGYYVAWPLLTSEKVESVAATSMDSNPTLDYLALERALADVDFDHAAGKIDEAEWQTLRAPLVLQLEKQQDEAALEVPVSSDDWEMEILIARARRARDKRLQNSDSNTDRSTNLVS